MANKTIKAWAVVAAGELCAVSWGKGSEYAANARAHEYPNSKALPCTITIHPPKKEKK